ncbi:S41 family peptidase [Uliginosibacterium sp. H1]|uniref:S41 family peptidase n=1 Tax=Uliginosibacterium sp. H1 TaxID=3114757 RepID=UPI002E18CB22|nr:S41 family peptidase [Uliginosibacterium sp. H1]
MSSKFKQAGLVMSGVVVGVLLSLHFSARADREGPTPLPVEEMRAFATVFEAIKQNYVDSVDDKKLVKNAVSGMVSGLDPHSTYLDQEEKKDLQVSISGEFGGLGIEVGMEDGFVKVVSPIEDTPAFRAGVKAGDLIVRLDNESVKGLSLNDAVKRMRGKPGTKINLTIARKGAEAPIEVTLTREVIKVQSVKSKLIEPGYGYVRLTQFQRNTTSDLVRHLDRIYKQGPVKGLVLDLRNDPGGLLNNAVGVSAAFLPKDALVVYTDGRLPDAKTKFFASLDYYRADNSGDDPLKGLPPEAKKVPIVVLVNGGSASASEIVAGALQDYKRATILGTQTFGKGSVQSVIDLPGGTAVKITTARYFTPNGRSIQAKGIEPDLLVEETAGANFPRLREADLQGHLSNPKDGAAVPAAPTKATEEKAPPPAKVDNAPPIEFGTKGDFQFEQAVNHLKGLPVQTKPVTPTAETSAPAVAPVAPPEKAK